MRFSITILPTLIFFGATTAAPTAKNARFAPDEMPTMTTVVVPDDVLAEVIQLPGLQVAESKGTKYLLFSDEYVATMLEKRGTSISDADAGFNSLYILRAEADAEQEANVASEKRGTSISDADAGFNSLYILRAEADAEAETEATNKKRGTSIPDADAGFNSLYILRAEADAETENKSSS